MLVSKVALIGKMVTLRFDTGEEVFGVLSSESETHYTLSNPQTLVAAHSQNGQPGVGLREFMMTADNETVDVAKVKVQAVAQTKQAIVDEVSRLRSGLITPNAPAIIMP